MEGRAQQPPAARLLGFELLEIDPEAGRLRAKWQAKPEFTNPAGMVQGGFLAAMLDDTMSPALMSTLAPGEFTPTLELKVNFIAPAMPGVLVSEGWVVSRGGTIAFLSGELRTEGGDLVATATATVRIVKGASFGPPS